MKTDHIVEEKLKAQEALATESDADLDAYFEIVHRHTEAVAKHEELELHYAELPQNNANDRNCSAEAAEEKGRYSTK